MTRDARQVAGKARIAAPRAGLVPNARLAGPMPWVIAIMIALTVVAAAAGLSLKNVAANARSEIDGGLTVQLVEAAPAARERQARAALAVLSARADVTEIRRVPQAELQQLMEPWLGQLAQGTEEEALPLPAMIDVRLSGEVTPGRVDELQAAIAAVAPAARVDAQAQWLAPVFDAISALQLLAVALIGLLAATSAAAVWLAARSSLGSNRDTIEIVHLLGGTDGQIARLFQNSIAVDAAIGGAAGLLLGLFAVIVLARQFAQLGSGMVAGGGLGPLDWALLAAIPMVGIVLAMLTARITVLAAVRKML